MSSYEGCVWSDVLDIGNAHILLDKPWLYDLDITCLGRSNTYEFKFKEKKIVLKAIKPKSNVGNNKEGTSTEKNSKSPCYLVTRSHFSPESSIDGSTLGSRNSLSLLPLPLGISLIATVEPFTHLCELHDHDTKQMTINNYNYHRCKVSQVIAESRNR